MLGTRAIVAELTWQCCRSSCLKQVLCFNWDYFQCRNYGDNVRILGEFLQCNKPVLTTAKLRSNFKDWGHCMMLKNSWKNWLADLIHKSPSAVVDALVHLGVHVSGWLGPTSASALIRVISAVNLRLKKKIMFSLESLCLVKDKVIFDEKSF